VDIILENATVVDGSGGVPFNADVGIEREAVRAVGDLRGSEAARRMDVRGKVVCPGFIDAHSHADLTLFREDHARLLEPLVRQGITTFVGGNCGMALSPVTRRNRDATATYLEVFTQMDFDRDVRWESTSEFMGFVEERGLLLNAALLAPHGVMRTSASGLSRRPCSPEEIGAMKGLLAESMEAGAFGLSAGLQYFPGSSAETAEVVELASVIAPYEGVFACHLRSYTNTTLSRAVAEVGEVARANGIRGHVSHIFSIPWFGPLHRPLLKGLKWLARHPQAALRFIPGPLLDMEMERIIGYLDGEKEKGAVMSMDVMPTTAGFTHLLAFFPPWALEGTGSEVMARIKDPAVRREMLADIERGKPTWPHRGRNDWSLNIMRQLGWDAVTVMAVHSEKNRHLEGMTFVEIGAEQDKHPFDAMCDLLLEEEGEVLVFESLTEPDDAFTERYTYPAILDPDTMITTDTILLGMGKPSYLFYGCYPKFIHRYVYEKGLLSLPEAVRRCTSLPAECFGISWRGMVREGYFADLLVMDAPRFRSGAYFRQPEVFPQGLEMVLVNGKVVVEAGEPVLGVMAGSLLRRNDQKRPG
jgi:N-acyl-D-aspartate/D-glutamate deacylase